MNTSILSFSVLWSKCCFKNRLLMNILIYADKFNLQKHHHKILLNNSINPKRRTRLVTTHQYSIFVELHIFENKDL